ncbi:hypothetical protein MNV49_002826 [Pseudohyphozyma bogoriensis]|nr:hypothetical protein MNV49_002826 [Pseudohyphozyma bogoriensis]
MAEDPDFHALVAKLHLEDLAALPLESNAERVAFTLYKKELVALQAFEADRRLALSINTAVQADGPAVEAHVAAERQAEQDRSMARDLAAGRRTPTTTRPSPSTRSPASSLSSPVPSQAKSTAPSKVPSLTSQMDALRLSPAGATSSPSEVDCVICGDSLYKSSAIKVPCPHGHHYCRHCLRDLAVRAMDDETLMPPRCDGVPIPMELITPRLTPEQQKRFASKKVEFGTPDRLYCSTATCSKFLGAATSAAHKRSVQCGDCSSSTYSACKAPWHGAFGACGKGSDAEVVDAITREHGFQRCPTCRRLVELSVGCYHM